MTRTYHRSTHLPHTWSLPALLRRSHVAAVGASGRGAKVCHRDENRSVRRESFVLCYALFGDDIYI